MSGTAIPDPIYTDPNFDAGAAQFQQLKDVAKAALAGIAQAPSSLMSIVQPDPKTLIPGTRPAALLYNFASEIVNGITSLRVLPPNQEGYSDDMLKDILTGKPPEGLHLPLNEEVAAAGDRTKQAANKVFPIATPDGPYNNVGREVVDMALSQGVPGTGALLKGARYATPFLNTLLPMSSAGPRMTTAVGAFGGTLEALKEEEARKEEERKATITDTRGSILDPNAPQGFDVSGLNDSGVPADKPYEISDEMRRMVHGRDSGVTYAQVLGPVALGAIALGGLAFRRSYLAKDIAAAKVSRYEQTGKPIIEAYDSANYGAPGSMPTDVLPSVPLPPLSGSASTSLAKTGVSEFVKRYVKSNETRNNIVDFYAPSPVQADVLKAKLDQWDNKTFSHKRTELIATTGFDATTGTRMPSQTVLQNEIAASTSAKRELYNNYVHALDEMDNRNNIGAFTGSTNMHTVQPNTPTRAVNFSAYTTEQLEAIIAAGKYDKDVVSWAERDQGVNRGLMKMAEAEGMISREQRLAFEAQHPNHLSAADINGGIADPFRARDMELHSGVNMVELPAWEKNKQHLEMVVDDIRVNNFRQALIDAIYDGQNRYPKTPKLLSPSLDRSGENQLNALGQNPFQGGLTYVEKKNGASVGVRVNGKLEWHEVHNNELREMLRQSPEQISAVLNAAHFVTRIANSNTTGLGAALLGHFFPITQAGYAFGRTMVVPQRFMATGYVDRLAQSSTKGRVRLPGLIDPTSLAMVPVGLGSAGYRYAALGLASIMHPQADNTAVKLMRSWFGDAAVQAFYMRAHDAMTRTASYQMEAQGAGGIASMGTGVAPVHSLGSIKKKYSPLDAHVPGLYLQSPDSQGIVAQGTGLVKRASLAVHKVYDTVANAVGQSSQVGLFSINRNSKELKRVYGNDAQTMLVQNVRNVAGDPAQKGSSSALEGYGRIAQYLNAAIQDVAHLTSSIIDTPFKVALGFTTGIGIPILYSVYTAIEAGEDSVQEMINDNEAGAAARMIRIYDESRAPENNPGYKLNNTEAIVAAFFRQLVFDVLDVYNIHKDSAWYDQVRNGLSDFLGRKITTGTGNAVANMTSATISAPVPVIINAGVAAWTGKTLKLDPVALARDGVNSQTLLQSTGPNDPKITGMENHSTNDTALVKQRVQDMLGAILGIAGKVFMDATNAGTQTYAGSSDLWLALDSSSQVITQRMRDSLAPATGVLWNNNGQLTRRTQVDDEITSSVHAMRLTMTAKSDVRNPGMMSRNGPLAAMTPDMIAKAPKDPLMLKAYLATASVSQRILSEHGSYVGIENMQKELRTLLDKGMLPGSPQVFNPAERRVIGNELTRSMRIEKTKFLSQINDLNDMISNTVGHSTNIKTIDWSQGLEQFQK